MTNFILFILLSFQAFNNCSGVKMKQNGSKIDITYNMTADSIKRCDIEVVRKTNLTLEELEYADVFTFLYTFSEDCSKNAEYSEFSNEVLFKVLEKYPKGFIDCMSREKGLDLKYIYSELSTPIVDINGKVIYEKVQNVSGDNQIKGKILKAIQEAINY